jgi:hypothetical protein
MSKVKFDAAKELINKKDYVGARAILKGIDHPTAREWDRKIDQMQPPRVSKRTRDAIILLLLVLALIVVILLVNQNVPDTTAGIRDVLETMYTSTPR